MSDLKKTVVKKKFNLKEAQIENGWLDPIKSGYDKYKILFWETFHIIISASAIITLLKYRAWLDFSVETFFALPWYVILASVYVLGETVFHFGFLFGRTKKLNFWKETLPYKTISFVVGAIAALYSSAAAILGLCILPFWFNHIYGNYITKRNFDRMAEYYEPKEEVEYEEPEQRAPLKQIPQRIHQQTPPSVPKMDIISDSEFNQAYGDVNINNLNLPDMDKFMKKWF